MEELKRIIVRNPEMILLPIGGINDPMTQCIEHEGNYYKLIGMVPPNGVFQELMVVERVSIALNHIVLDAIKDDKPG